LRWTIPGGGDDSLAASLSFLFSKQARRFHTCAHLPVSIGLRPRITPPPLFFFFLCKHPSISSLFYWMFRRFCLFSFSTEPRRPSLPTLRTFFQVCGPPFGRRVFFPLCGLFSCLFPFFSRAIAHPAFFCVESCKQFLMSSVPFVVPCCLEAFPAFFFFLSVCASSPRRLEAISRHVFVCKPVAFFFFF